MRVFADGVASARTILPFPALHTASPWRQPEQRTNTARVKPVKTAARVGGDAKAARVESLCPERCRRATRAWKMA